LRRDLDAGASIGQARLTAIKLEVKVAPVIDVRREGWRNENCAAGLDWKELKQLRASAKIIAKWQRRGKKSLELAF